MNDLARIIMGTIGMVFLAVLIIVFVVWQSIAFKKIKDYLHARDKHYLDRITGMENLIKKEFLEVINSIKNL